MNISFLYETTNSKELKVVVFYFFLFWSLTFEVIFFFFISGEKKRLLRWVERGSVAAEMKG